VDSRERWQALQRSLSVARRWLDAGDREQALIAVDAALAIDPEFLAAQSLRERILAAEPAVTTASAESGGVNAARSIVVSEEPANIEAAATHQTVVAQDFSPVVSGPFRQMSGVGADAGALDLPLRPVISEPPIAAAGYAKFEQRAKRRRVDHRLDAARAAIAKGRLHDASAALNEVLNLDPNAPELAGLMASVEKLRRGTHAPRRGAWIAAMLVFGAMVLGASWLEQQQALRSRPIGTISGLVAAPQPAPLPSFTPPVESEAGPIGTSGLTPDVTSGSDAKTANMAESAAPRPTPRFTPPALEQPIEPLSNSVAPTPVTPPPALQRTAPPALTASSTSAASPPPVEHAVSPAVERAVSASVPAVDEAALVRQALQRYRTAYEGLDAGSAQAVWPAVDQGALARAFEGLESQTLRFDACDVQLQNEIASATCRGSASYVPKVGSREPRTEPRVWRFSLRKNGGEWQIDTARVER
jgi:tetratricopeptide (TPR) repeat protein